MELLAVVLAGVGIILAVIAIILALALRQAFKVYEDTGGI